MNFFENKQLQQWGWSEVWTRRWMESIGTESPWWPARVLVQERQLYRVVSLQGEVWAQVPGRWLQNPHTDFPVVGDWIAIEAPQGDRARVAEILPRSSLLTRKAAGSAVAQQHLGANIDETWICSSLNDDLSPERIERYVALVESGGALPVIVLSKADLDSEAESKRQALQRRWPRLEILRLSVKTGEGIQAFRQRLIAGKTYVLLGSSGVGKSSLVNALLKNETAVVSAIRESDSKGRHTTTGRHLFAMPMGALLMDTPGMRELQLSAESTDLSIGFEDLVLLESRCRFGNCGHNNEPGCFVNEALAKGDLNESRWKNYLKLKREAAFQERKGNKALQSAQKARWKKLSSR
jgi:ribosome biogenesis GTPase